MVCTVRTTTNKLLPRILSALLQNTSMHTLDSANDNEIVDTSSKCERYHKYCDQNDEDEG